MNKQNYGHDHFFCTSFSETHLLKQYTSSSLSPFKEFLMHALQLSTPLNLLMSLGVFVYVWLPIIYSIIQLHNITAISIQYYALNGMPVFYGSSMIKLKGESLDAFLWLFFEMIFWGLTAFVNILIRRTQAFYMITMIRTSSSDKHKYLNNHLCYHDDIHQ